MRDEYDFAEAQKGRFYHDGAVLRPPVHLDPDVLEFLSARARSYGLSLSQLVNAMLKQDIELIQAVD
jgi:hypothetical protein